MSEEDFKEPLRRVIEAYVLIPVCAHFIMRNASPHVRIILSYPPYAYGDQFLMCPCGVSDLLLSHALNPIFLHASAHTPIFLHASAHAQTSKNTTSTSTNIKKHNH
jgi:hypothetical protein